MDLQQAIQARHAVRSYTDRAIEGETLEQLRLVVEQCNRDSGLHIQLLLNEPEAFGAGRLVYGRLQNVKNYIALVGKKGEGVAEQCGYYGEKIVLRAQQLGLNTCWVAMSYSKGNCAAAIRPGEKLHLVIAVGYGTTPGHPRKTKSIDALCHTDGPMPDWFRRGMQAVQLAPTAINQQKIHFILEGNTVAASPGVGFYTKTDLGIAKYHFEVGAGTGGWKWK